MYSATTNDRCRRKGSVHAKWKGSNNTSSRLTTAITKVQTTAHGRISAPTHQVNSERPWQQVRTEHTITVSSKEDLGLQLPSNVFVEQMVQSKIYKPSIAWLIDAFNVSMMWLRALVRVVWAIEWSSRLKAGICTGSFLYFSRELYFCFLAFR